MAGRDAYRAAEALQTEENLFEVIGLLEHSPRLLIQAPSGLGQFDAVRATVEQPYAGGRLEVGQTL